MTEKILTQEQIDLIFIHLISRSHKRFFAIARYTGRKFGHICKLKVSDVYNDEKVPLSYIRFSGINSSVHYVPVCLQLELLLNAYIPETFNPDHWLFPSRIKEGKPITFKATVEWLERSVMNARLEHLNISTSSIRKAFIKSLYENKIDTSIIKEIIGVNQTSSLKIISEFEQKTTQETLQRIFG